VSDVNFNRLSLSWDSVEGADHYDVYQGTSSTAVTTKVGSVSETSFSTTNPLNFNTTYYYKVIPVTVNGISGVVSPVINGKTAIKNPVDLSVVSPNATSADLSWSAVEGAAGYEISYSKGSSTTYTILRSVTTLTTNHTGLSVNTVFNYRVRAYRMAGATKVFSGYSEVKSISTSTTNTSKITLVFEPINNVEFKLLWNQISGATEYVIYQFTENNEDNAIELYRTTNTEFVVSVNSMEDKFNYYVKSVSSNTSEVTSNTVLAGGVPNPVENVIISPQYDRAHLSWDLNEDAASYDVYMSTNPTVLGNKLGNTISNDYNTGSILNFGHYYYFRIVPVSKAGLTTDLTRLPKLYIVQAKLPKVESLNVESTKDNKTMFTWNSIEDADGYEIYYKADSYMNYTLLASIEANSNYLTNLSQDTNYLFKIKSFKQVGNSKIYSDFSDVTDFLTPLDTPNLDITNNTTGEIVLDWVTNDIATHFEIYVDNMLYKTVVNSKSITMKETVNDLPVGINYEFKLVAINQTNRSLASDVVVAMIHPMKVENLEVISTSYNSITLNWSASEGAQKYRILYGMDGILNQSMYVENQEFALVSNLLVNKTYQFVVIPQTIDGIGNNWSDQVYGTTKLDSTSNITIETAGDSTIELNWDPVAGAQMYVLTEFKNGVQQNKWYYSSTNSIVITNISSYTTYNFRISPYLFQNGVNEYGLGVMSGDYVYVSAQLNISETHKILDIGESFKLETYVYPENASYKDVRFISSNPTIATVDENGWISAVSPGTTKITAISGEDSKVCDVAVQLSFSGTGNQVIDNLSDLNNGQYNNNYKVVATHTGSGSFVLNSYQNTEMKLKTVFDEIGNYEGENLLYDGYTKDFLDVDLEIITEGEWTVKIVPMAGSSTSTMTGTGDTVTRWVKDILGTSNVTFTYNGTDEFSLWKVIRNSSQTLINSGTGPTTTTFSVYVPQVDSYQIAFVVQGSGDWSIDFNLGAEITQY
jgi:fibronectin type 3 domain-containing protein